MLSGIGPAAHLREFGIAVVVALPVGRNLQDHLGAYMTYRRKQPGSFHRDMRFDRMAASMIRAYLFGNGPGTVVPGGLHAFIKTRPELAVPDIEFMFRGTAASPHLWFPMVRPAYVDGFGIRPKLLHPDSRGELLLGSADPLAPPRASSIASSPRRTICRPCAKDLNVRARSPSRRQWILIATRR